MKVPFRAASKVSSKGDREKFGIARKPEMDYANERCTVTCRVSFCCSGASNFIPTRTMVDRGLLDPDLISKTESSFLLLNLVCRLQYEVTHLETSLPRHKSCLDANHAQTQIMLNTIIQNRPQWTTS